MSTSLSVRARPIGGRDLRYLLTSKLFEHGPLSLHRLVELVAADGFDLDGRRSKVVSDSLRWEVARGRAVRLGRGRYGPGVVPPTTAWRIRHRVQALTAER